VEAVRILVTSTAGAGHFGPLVPVAAAAARREDEMLFVVPPGLQGRAEATGHQVQLGADPSAEEMAAIRERVQTASRSEGSVLINREVFGRLCTAAMLPAVEAACRRWQPDLILHEAAEYASVIAAGRCGRPHAQIAIGLAGIEASSLDLVTPTLQQYGDQVAALLRTSPYLTRIPVSLDPSPFPATYRYRESTEAPPEPLPDWWHGDDAPLAYISFGSVAGRLARAKTTFAYRAAIAAVADLRLRVLLTTGQTRDPAELGPLPANVHAETWVDQGQALGHASLVICHGGAGTTFGALGFGLPVIFVPIMADQPVNARLVTSAGAGILVEPSAELPATAAPDQAASQRWTEAERLTGQQIRAAIEAVLSDTSYQRSANRIAEHSRAAPALDEVLGRLARASAGPALARPTRPARATASPR
jgi:UDP:flavonoid glycosyltransferase YjiC (YdhE family)